MSGTLRVPDIIPGLVPGITLESRPGGRLPGLFRCRLAAFKRPLEAALDGAGEVELRLPGRYTLDALRGALKTAPEDGWLEEMG